MFIRKRLKAFRMVTLYYCDGSPSLYSPFFYSLCSCHYSAVQFGSGRCSCRIGRIGLNRYTYLGISRKLPGLPFKLRARLPVP